MQPRGYGAKRSSRVDAAPRGGRGDTETVVNALFWIMRLLTLIFVTLSSEIFESSRDFLEPHGASYIFGQATALQVNPKRPDPE